MRTKLFLGWILTLLIFSAAVHAQTTAFTYQGRLTDSAMPGTASYLMEFKLFGASSGGTAIDTLSDVPVSVANNIFTVQLNFTAANAFDGTDRFLDISVKRTAGDTYTPLTPRQQVTSAPYAIRTLKAGSSDSLSGVCNPCVTDAQIISLDGSKINGAVANATNAVNVTSVVPIANGGTGSSTKDFVDLTTNQTIGGTKTFTGLINWGSTPPSGLLGQPLATAFSTGSVSPGAAFVLIPGLSVTIDVPAICSSGSTACIAYVTADGGVQTTSAVTTGVSRVDIVLTVDGVLAPAGAYRRVIAANTGGSTSTIENWSLGHTTPLSPGTHTIAVMTALQSGSAANVGGSSTSVLQGRLTVVILRQ